MSYSGKWVSSIEYVRKFLRNTNISYPLICIRTCAYQGVRNISFLENFAYVRNEWFYESFLLISWNVPFLYPLKTSENFVFRGYKIGKSAWSGLRVCNHSSAGSYKQFSTLRKAGSRIFNLPIFPACNVSKNCYQGLI